MILGILENKHENKLLNANFVFSVMKNRMDNSSEFLIIKWSSSKIYTLINNFKNLQPNVIVRSKINNADDIGEVIFAGNFWT